MKLVIDIPEEMWEWLHNGFLDEDDGKHAINAILKGTPLPRCKDCKHFVYDEFAIVNGIPIIVAHEICMRWSSGCRTKEDGYCHMFEPKTESEVQE